MPITMPSSRTPSERSSWSTQIASTAVKIGAVATRIPASAEEISCSPSAIKQERAGHLHGPDQRHGSGPAAHGPERPLEAANGTSTAAASAIRAQATIGADRSRSPILMNM